MILEANYLHICEEICLHLLQGKYNDGIDKLRITGYRRTRPRPVPAPPFLREKGHR